MPQSHVKSVLHALQELCSTHGLVGADPRILCHIDKEFPAGYAWTIFLHHERKALLLSLGPDLHLTFIEACKILARYAKGEPLLWTETPKTLPLFTNGTASGTAKSP